MSPISVSFSESHAFEAVLASTLRATVPLLPNWERLILPPLSGFVEEMIAAGDLPIAIAEAFDDLGQFCQRLGSDIMVERDRRGMPLPPGPDDAADEPEAEAAMLTSPEPGPSVSAELSTTVRTSASRPSNGASPS